MSEAKNVWKKDWSQTEISKELVGGQTQQKTYIGGAFLFSGTTQLAAFLYYYIFLNPQKYYFEPDWWVRSPVACQQFHSNDVIDQIILKFWHQILFFVFFWDKNISYLKKWLQQYYDQGWQS